MLGDGTFIPKRQTISHKQTALMVVPFLAVEVMILLIFTFADPNEMEESFDITQSGVTHRIICAHDTWAFFSVQLIYQGGLVLVGCFLGKIAGYFYSLWVWDVHDMCHSLHRLLLSSLFFSFNIFFA